MVADEVRKLAERTGRATSEIAQVITTIQEDADRAVGDMRSVVTRFGSIADTTREAGASIVEIRSGSDRVMGVTRDISTALQEQSSASENIARQVEIIAAMSESNSTAINGLNVTAGTMDALARTMHGQLAKFVV